MAAEETTATVKMFAALRESAGTDAVEVPAPTTLPVLLADVRGRFGPDFTSRLTVAAIMIDGQPVDAGGDAAVPAGAEVALLPPFAGGSTGVRRAGTDGWPTG